jgi:hypothetical protein
MAMWGQNDWLKGIQSKNGANALIGLGTGLLQGNTFAKGLAAGGQGFMQGAELDQQYADAEADKLKQTEEGKVTRSWLEQQGFTDLIPLVDAGQTGLAYNEAFKRMQPGYGQAETVKPIEVNGQLVDPMTGRVIGDYRDPNSGMGDAPSGYQWNPDGTQGFIPGGPADPANMGKTTEAQRRNQQLASVIQPELATVEQNWNELASGGNQAANAVPFGAGFGMTSPGYQQATNSLATIAQSYLYSVSGAAAPAEEVAKLVDSVTPKPFESPQSIEAKRARIRQMAAAVIQAGGAGGPPAQTAPGGQTSTGLQWSIEP